ncbi:translation initiation factor IF-2-like [Phocoena sinus]|uniref:translation initiation factor IF-2-like n=1 Tax=Phocoena sinus TaxID=42100 RepID=UPI0013C48EB9|nr:translation initiation factor IF-2-like [Phocoena sinus]
MGELQSKDCPLRNPELERNGSAFKPIQKNSVVSWEQPRESLANAERRRLPGRLCQSCVFHDLLEFAILQASSLRQRDVQGPGPTSRTASPGLRGSPPGPFAAARTATGSGREAGALRPCPGQTGAGGGSHRDRGPAGRDRAGRESARQEVAGPTAAAPRVLGGEGGAGRAATWRRSRLRGGGWGAGGKPGRRWRVSPRPRSGGAREVAPPSGGTARPCFPQSSGPASGGAGRGVRASQGSPLRRGLAAAARAGSRAVSSCRREMKPDIRTGEALTLPSPPASSCVLDRMNLPLKR